MMDSALALLAAVAATGFGLDLWLDYRKRPRPHIAAYAIGMTMFAIATWCFFIGLTFGWTGPVYRTFFLFGAVLNIPFLALGSMFLVVGRRAGHVMAIGLGALTAISLTLTATVPFANPLPEGGVPHDIFASGFGPRLFAIIGGALGSTILIGLALVSVFRFWRSNRHIVWGNLLIVGGTFAAASGGTGVALGEGSWFALSLLVAVTLIWLGYRIASGKRDSSPREIEIDAREDGVHQPEI
ncbi:MAG: hypothetical protein ACR2NL_09235 [Acidimicrobiia bacterium]